jgi:hypothetical protein
MDLFLLTLSCQTSGHISGSGPLSPGTYTKCTGGFSMPLLYHKARVIATVIWFSQTDHHGTLNASGNRMIHPV